MEVTIRGRNTEVSEALRQATEEKVTRLSRFFDGMDHAEVQFSEERNPRIAEREVCEVVIQGHGHLVRAKSASTDPFARALNMSANCTYSTLMSAPLTFSLASAR